MFCYYLYMKRTWTKDEVETKARELFGVGFDALTSKERQSWLRSASYRLRVQAVVEAIAYVRSVVDNAVENESTTKGWDNAHQGAWDNATFYAEEAGVEVEAFRKYMVKKMCGQFTRESR